MATVKDLITEAYDNLNYPGTGQTLPASDLTNAFKILNRLLESWSIQRLLPFLVQRETFSLVSGTQTYTIGTGGTFNTGRPNRILHMTLNSDSNDYPMQELTYNQWMDIFNKENGSNIPHYFYYEKDYALGKINIYPKPSDSTSTITIASEKALGPFALESSTISLPPGYERALVFNLAEELLSKFPVDSVALFIRKQAKSSLDNLRSLNMENVMTEMNVDYNMMYNNYNDGEYYFWNGN